MTPSALSLSVIVPFKGGDGLAHLIGALKKQTVDPRCFELLLVHETGYPVDPQLSAGCEFDLSVVSYERPFGFSGHSAGPMRNKGIRRAGADRVMFVDSDCVPAPDVLARHCAQGAELVVCGLARELPATVPHERLERLGHDELWVLSSRDWRERHRDAAAEGGWLNFYTCNASAPRDLVIKAGLFDEAGYRCHDLDLGYRLQCAGARFELDTGCQVIHLEHPRSVWFREDQIEGWRRLGDKHPELRALTEDKIVGLRRSLHAALNAAETRFRALTRDLPGVRCGYTWVLAPSTPAATVRAAMGGVPCTRVARHGAEEIFLRLEKNCWDYSLLLPERVDRPVISVAIAAYNAERTIGRAVESVLRQTFQSFELIVVDDASTDLTSKTLAPYLCSQRVRLLLAGSNRGLAHALNRALEACRGAYLLQLDADDWLEPDALEKLIDAFERNPDVGAVYGAPRVYRSNELAASGARVETGFPVSTPVDCLTYPRLAAPRTYRVDALADVGGWRIDDAFQGRYFEDRVMLAALAERHRLLYWPETLYNVVERNGSLSRTPLRATSAKLGILYGQAARSGMTLSYACANGFVSAARFAGPPPAERRAWSVIVPFFGSSELLRLTLKSWLESDVRDRVAELVLVVDGPETAVDFDDLPGGLPLRRLQLPQRSGAAAARNAGARVAGHQWLFFSDSDRIVPPEVLRLHEARHAAAAGPALVVGDVFGRRTFSVVPPSLSARRKRRLLEMMRFDPAFAETAARLLQKQCVRLLDPAADGVWQAAQRYAFTDSWQAPWAEIILQYGEDLKYFPHRWLRVGAGSLSMSRATFDAVGGFDETFQAMEDWDFGVRAQEIGCTVVCAPEAEPLHQAHPVLEGRVAAEDDARLRLAARHPSAVEHLARAGAQLVPPGGEQFLHSGAASARTAQAAKTLPCDIVLSFDDGPHERYSHLVLDALQAVGAPAVFFVLGSRVKRCAGVLARMAREGHEIGVHSFYHKNWSDLTRQELLREVSETRTLIEDAAGVSVTYYRPPYGMLPVHGAAVCDELGLTAIGWDVSSRDWLGSSSKDVMIELATRECGGVLLFHDGYGAPESSAAVVRWLVPACRVAGVRPVRLSEYLLRHEPPRTPALSA